MITEGGGIPLAVILTGGNVNDVTQLLPLVEAIPPVRGKRGRPRRRPDALYAGRHVDDHDDRGATRRPTLTRTPQIAPLTTAGLSRSLDSGRSPSGLLLAKRRRHACTYSEQGR